MATLINSTGVTLALSGSPTKWASAKAGATFTGTSANDAIYTGNGSTMVGGDGDDTYYVYYKTDVVVEKPNQGIDTIISTTSSYTLPDNVENLTITGTGAIGIGNSGDNVIMGGGTGPQTMNGGAGNDVLVAGVGKDTFVFANGEGSDVIVGFKANDVVQLNGYSLLSNFAKVQAAMTQVGADTVIKLSASETLTLRDHKIADFTADNFRLPFDKQPWKLTFSEEFNSFSGSATGKGTTWMTTYPYSGIASRTLYTNKEAEYYSDSSVGVNPFTVRNGVLDITAARATPGVETPADSGLTWTSGLITTYKSFSQLYGYFEVSAQLPAGKGFWPAFWLLPADNTWPPELDVFEVLGQDPTTLYASTHSKVAGPDVGTKAVTVADTSKGFHTYAVNWQSDYITWYVDGYAVSKAATPADMHKPMYMLLNLGVGAAGSWPGATDASTPEGHMLVDYVRAYTEMPQILTPSNPLIDSNFYLSANPDVKLAGIDPAIHYFQNGAEEGRNPDALFSTDGYLAANRDVAAIGMNPLTHYDQYGWKEGRDPSAGFDNEQYLAHNPDVKAAGLDPLAHYLQYGQAEGRQTYAAIGKAADFTHGSFDAEYYLLANADIAKAALAAGGDTFAFAYQHYDQYGWKEGRMADAFFDSAYYLAHNPDIAALGIDPLTHYDTYGWKEGRDPSAAFNTNAYLAANPDVAAAHIDPLTHYLQYGANEGRHLA